MAKTVIGRRAERPVPRLRVGFILARRFTLCAFANFVDVLRLAADEGDRSRQILCEWSVLSDTMDPVLSSCGVTVQATARLGDPAAFDYIVVVGGLIAEIPSMSRATSSFLAGAAASAVPLIGVCTGAFLLHRVGLMDGYKCCVSWFHHSDFLEQFEGIRPVSDQIFVVDRDRLTCSGGVSSAHLAAYLVEKHVGVSQARKSLQIMIIEKALAAEEPQPSVGLAVAMSDDFVKKALSHMQQNMAAPLKISEISRRVGIDRRQLERRFAKVLGLSPSIAYMTLRIEQAEKLLRTSRQFVASIAVSTGFCDSSHLTRVLKKWRSTTPAALRSGGVQPNPIIQSEDTE